MHVDTGNFHVFFPQGCYRDRPTSRRQEIFDAIDRLVQSERFDLTQFNRIKQLYLESIDSDRKDETFSQLNTLIAPLFLRLLDQGFSVKELQNYEGHV